MKQHNPPLRGDLLSCHRRHNWNKYLDENAPGHFSAASASPAGRGEHPGWLTRVRPSVYYSRGRVQPAAGHTASSRRDSAQAASCCPRFPSDAALTLYPLPQKPPGGWGSHIPSSLSSARPTPHQPPPRSQMVLALCPLTPVLCHLPSS